MSKDFDVERVPLLEMFTVVITSHLGKVGPLSRLAGSDASSLSPVSKNDYSRSGFSSALNIPFQHHKSYVK